MSNSNEGGEDRIHIRNPHAEISVDNSKQMASSTDIFTDRLSFRPANEIALSQNWDYIPAIHKSRGTQIDKSEDLIFAVELPLYKAARMLYDAGIVTTESNAHFEPGANEAVIALVIQWSSLNDEQKYQANAFCKEEPDIWKHELASETRDGREILSLGWKIKKNSVSPRQVKAYVDHKVNQLIAGRLKIGQ